MQPEFKAKLVAAALIAIRTIRAGLKYAIVGLNKVEEYVLSKTA